MADNTSKIKELLKKALTLLPGSEDEGDDDKEAAPTKPTLPSLKALTKLDDEEVLELAAGFGIETKKAKIAKALLTTACGVIAEDDDIEEDDLTALCEAIGIEPTEDDADATKASITEFFSNEPAKSDEDDEAAPKKAKKSKTPTVDDDDDDADDAPKGKKAKKPEADDDDDDDDKDGDDDDDGPTEEQLKAHKKAHKKADYDSDVECADDVEELKGLLTDEKDKTFKWGVPYVKGSAGFCCGLPLLDVDGEDNQGKCAVTGKVFEFNAKKRSFTQVEE